MKKIFILSILLFTTIYARKNPFAPINMIPVDKKQETILPTIKIQKNMPTILPVEHIKEPKATTFIEKKPLISISEPVIIKEDIKIDKPKTHKHNKRKYTKKRIKHSLRQTIIYNGKYIKIKIKKGKIIFFTRDKMIKNFSLKKPTRFVFDFERFDPIPPYFKNINTKTIKSIKVGHHGYFYRVILTLKYPKRYKIKQKSNAYSIYLLSM